MKVICLVDDPDEHYKKGLYKQLHVYEAIGAFDMPEETSGYCYVKNYEGISARNTFGLLFSPEEMKKYFRVIEE